jgi:hypothetical protein
MFLLDLEGSSNLIAHDVIDEPAHVPAMAPGRMVTVADDGELQLQHGPKLQPHEMAQQGHKRVIRWVEFQPELPHLDEAKKKGLKFTQGRKYPIFKEATHPQGLSFGMVFTLMDDARREVTTSDKYFIPAKIRLDGENEVDGGWDSGPSGGKNDIPLDYGKSFQKDELIDIRAAARGRNVR